MKAVVIATALTLIVAATSVAAAGGPDTVVLKVSVQAGGTRTAPRPVTPSFNATVTGPGGVRASVVSRQGFSWDGVREMGRYFPTCTAPQIEKAQSDAGCDPRALVAEGRIVAKIGPSMDRTQSIDCKRSVRYYNAGPGRMAIYNYGPASDCAGVGYISPAATTWVLHDGRSVNSTEYGDNLKHPLPGLDGGFALVELKFKSLTTLAKLPGFKRKVRVGYLTSFGCKGTRKMLFDSYQEDGNHVHVEAVAGKC